MSTRTLEQSTQTCNKVTWEQYVQLARELVEKAEQRKCSTLATTVYKSFTQPTTTVTASDFNVFFPSHHIIKQLAAHCCDCINDFAVGKKSFIDKFADALQAIRGDMIEMAKQINALHSGDRRSRYLAALKCAHMIESTLAMVHTHITVHTDETVYQYYQLRAHTSWQLLFETLSILHLKTCNTTCTVSHASEWCTIGFTYIHSIYKHLCSQLACAINNEIKIK